jgi:PmbA protein
VKEELLRVANRVVDTAATMDICCEAFVQKKRHTSIIIESGKVTFGSQDGDYGIGIRDQRPQPAMPTVMSAPSSSG